MGEKPESSVACPLPPVSIPAVQTADSRVLSLSLSLFSAWASREAQSITTRSGLGQVISVPD